MPSQRQVWPSGATSSSAGSRFAPRGRKQQCDRSLMAVMLEEAYCGTENTKHVGDPVPIPRLE